MKRMVDRRTVLRSCAGLLAAAPFARFARAAEAPALTKLSEKLALVTGCGGNVVALSAGESLVLVDSGARERTRALLTQLKAIPGGNRVQTLFNTHCHEEHTGGNEVFGRSGAKIIAHEKTRLRLSTDVYVPTEDRYRKARPKEAWPTESFYTQGELAVPGERIEYGYLLQAHTDGDAYVFFRDSNVLVVGDAVSPVRDPEFDWFAGGWIGGRIDSQARLLELADGNTKIVPGWGPVITRAELEAERELMVRVYERMTELMRKGYTTDAMFEAGVVEGLGRELQDPYRFVYAAHKGLWAHHNTISHDIV